MRKLTSWIICLAVIFTCIAPSASANNVVGYYNETDGNYYYTDPSELALEYQQHIKHRETAFCVYFDLPLASRSDISRVVTTYFYDNWNDDPVMGCYPEIRRTMNASLSQKENGLWSGRLDIKNVNYLFSPGEEARVDAEFSKMLTESGAKTKSSDYEKTKAVYEYLMSHLSYCHDDDPTGRINSPQNAILNKTSMCNGFSKLLYRMLLTVGVQNKVVTGFIDDKYHAVNIIKIDGRWYWSDITVDVCSNDKSTPKAFLLGSNQFTYFTPKAESLTSRYNVEPNKYVSSVVAVTKPSFIYTDIKQSDWYYDAVEWAASNNITNGIGSGLFSPNAKSTRAQLVTLCYRMAGRPYVPPKSTIFTDIAPDARYYDAVIWATENGLTNGISDNTFMPDKQCTRAEIVTMLYRMAGSPCVTHDDIFKDVPSDHFAHDAISWAYACGITSGCGNNTFRPNRVCTRAEIVTFMYRYATHIGV